MTTDTEFKVLEGVIISTNRVEDESIEMEDSGDIFDGSDDIDTGNWRFIHTSAIDRIQLEEMGADEYILGCFTPWALADATGISIEVFEALQRAEAFEAIGKLVQDLGKLEALQQVYAAADGYGHHFASYDGNEHDVRINGVDYLAFRVN